MDDQVSATPPQKPLSENPNEVTAIQEDSLLKNTNRVKIYSLIGVVLLLVTVPVGVILVQRNLLPGAPRADVDEVLQCTDIKIYDLNWNLLSVNDIEVGQTVRLAVGANFPAQAVKARFSMNGGTTWQETTDKNPSGEYFMEMSIPDESAIAIEAQVFSPGLGWR